MLKPPVMLRRNVDVILIPEGQKAQLAMGTAVLLTQALGGSFTIQTNDGRKYRLAGRDADAIDEPIPEGADAHEADPSELTKEQIKELAWDAMKQVHDPEIPINVVDLGLIYRLDLHQRGDGLYVADADMTLTAPGCGMGDVIAADVRMALESVPGVGAATVQVVFTPVWNPNERLSDAAKLQLGLL